MNLLTYKNRFSATNLSLTEIAEGNGYTLALVDLLKWLEDKTQFDPAKRMINALDVIELIQETNEAIAEIFRGIVAKSNLSSDKVNGFLNGANDIPDELFNKTFN